MVRDSGVPAEDETRCGTSREDVDEQDYQHGASHLAGQRVRDGAPSNCCSEDAQEDDNENGVLGFVGVGVLCRGEEENEDAGEEGVGKAAELKDERGVEDVAEATGAASMGAPVVIAEWRREESSPGSKEGGG